MTDPILDDVQDLLDKEFGDKRILEQILRAAKNDEVISNFERNYVRKLAEKHLGKKPPVEKKIEEPKVTPDVVIPPIQPQKPQTVQTWAEKPKVSKSSSNNTKIILGIGIAALIIIVVAAASMGNVGEISKPPEVIQQPLIPQGFSIQTDLPSYQKGDIISISGNSDSGAIQVNLSIQNSDNVIIWSEQVSAKDNGQFSTLTFAGGSGWEKEGLFTIIAEINSEQATNSFSFSG